MPVDATVRAAVEITRAATTAQRTVDITTTGRRTGLARRIEIFFYRVRGEIYLCSGTVPSPSWYVNLLAHPEFTFHLKHGVRADLRATATPVTDEAQRREVLTEIVADLNQPSNPGHLVQPISVADWLNCRLVRITFVD
ncbi:nitroreductase/quinone reductase family protein [Prauserella cavernicola]|uniref:Nitroreductase family deazaflavin-dependent oxidoreductase n=1 Tax=Prauserella cavernicola TaxID=2800127 RepID=A0A934QQN1_9PSEU|nr:nitroreductase/quinone reductase family protein [Prauserella cavernicola]MBK1784308.1 nitroreductase family deazaflavin-dependent oxidoreductase [Prauserella cavernicola]